MTEARPREPRRPLHAAWRMTWARFGGYWLAFVVGMLTADLINWLSR